MVITGRIAEVSLCMQGTTITTDRVYGEATEADPPKRRTRGRRDADKADKKEADAAKEADTAEDAEKPAEEKAADNPAE